MNKDNAYQGHETWWNAFRMSFKMVVLTFKYCLAVQIVLFIVISKIYMPEGSATFAFEYMRMKGIIVLNNPLAKIRMTGSVRLSTTYFGGYLFFCCRRNTELPSGIPAVAGLL